MTEYQKETAFLRQIILFDDTAELRTLDDRIAQAQRDERCVQRAVSLLSFLATLAVLCFVYAAILMDDFPDSASQPVVRLIGEIALAALISIGMLACLQRAYRKKLNCVREDSRRLILKLLGSRLGEPDVALSPDAEAAECITKGDQAAGRLEFLPDAIAGPEHAMSAQSIPVPEPTLPQSGAIPSNVRVA